MYYKCYYCEKNLVGGENPFYVVPGFQKVSDLINVCSNCISLYNEKKVNDNLKCKVRLCQNRKVTMTKYCEHCLSKIRKINEKIDNLKKEMKRLVDKQREIYNLDKRINILVMGTDDTEMSDEIEKER
jgi:predicted RNase H-like nuclease (RuvC/YqgF family)